MPKLKKSSQFPSENLPDIPVYIFFVIILIYLFLSKFDIPKNFT